MAYAYDLDDWERAPYRVGQALEHAVNTLRMPGERIEKNLFQPELLAALMGNPDTDIGAKAWELAAKTDMAGTELFRNNQALAESKPKSYLGRAWLDSRAPLTPAMTHAALEEGKTSGGILQSLRNRAARGQLSVDDTRALALAQGWGAAQWNTTETDPRFNTIAARAGWPEVMQQLAHINNDESHKNPEYRAYVNQLIPEAWPYLAEMAKCGDHGLGDDITSAAEGSLYGLFVNYPHELGPERFEQVLLNKDGKYSHSTLQDAIHNTPFKDHWRRFGVHETNVIELIHKNPHITPQFAEEMLDRYGKNVAWALAYRHGLWPDSPTLKAKMLQHGLDDANLAVHLLGKDFLTPEEMKPLLQRHPHLKQHIPVWQHPDIHAESQVNVAFNTGKLRQLRDLIREKGVEALPPKQLPAGDWKAFRDEKGNISAQKLDEAIAAAPRTAYNVTHSNWDGAQRHDNQDSKVFQLNLTNDQMRRMKEAGVWDTFRDMYSASERSGHPVGPAGIGWVRWTGDHKGIHIDEVQSDFGQSFVKQAKARAREQGVDEEEAGRRAEEQWPEAHQKQIEDILFQGRHPSEVLQEAFQEWLRTPRTVKEGGVPDNCPKCGQDAVERRGPITDGDERWEYDPEGPTWYCGYCGRVGEVTPETTKTVSHVGTPVHIWQPESKAQISLGNPEGKLPGHFYVGYRDVPQKRLGWKPGQYGELPTQTNPELKGKTSKEGPLYVNEDGEEDRQPGATHAGTKVSFKPAAATFKDTVRKAEHYDAQAVSIVVEDPQGRVLMGLRQQGGWTLPGGHMDGPETAPEAAVRELWEEAGLTPLFLEYLGSSMCAAGLPVHVYRAVAYGTPTSENDPDREVSEWRWFPTLPNGLPPEVLQNLAHKPNVALDMMGLGDIVESMAKSHRGHMEFTLAPGTELFHGTSAPEFDPQQLRAGWLTADPHYARDVAYHPGNYEDEEGRVGGSPRVLRYSSPQALRLAVGRGRPPAKPIPGFHGWVRNGENGPNTDEVYFWDPPTHLRHIPE